MPKSYTVAVNPRILKWARESIEMPIDEAARKLKIKTEKLNQFEIGKDKPTFAQLKKIAQLYKRTTAVFFLRHIPKSKYQFKDLRDTSTYDVELHPKVLVEIRKAQYKQTQALNVSKLLDEPIHPFIWKTNLKQSPEQLAKKWRDVFNLDIKIQKKFSDEYKAFRFWKKAIEDLQVLIFQAPLATTSSLDALAIYNKQYPFILLNTKNAIHDRIFALLHEFCHLLLQVSGIGDMNPLIHPRKNTQKIEKFCNHFAGACLVPCDLFELELAKTDFKNNQIVERALLETLTKAFRTNWKVILRRLLDLNKISVQSYLSAFEEFSPILDKKKSRGMIRIPQHTLALSYNGNYYSKLILSSFKIGKISVGDAVNSLGVKSQYFDAMRRKLYD